MPQPSVVRRDPDQPVALEMRAEEYLKSLAAIDIIHRPAAGGAGGPPQVTQQCRPCAKESAFGWSRNAAVSDRRLRRDRRIAPRLLEDFHAGTGADAAGAGGDHRL